MRNPCTSPRIGVLLLVGALAAACGDADTSERSGGVDTRLAADIASGLPEGAFELTVTGARENTGEYTWPNSDPVWYRRADDGANDHGPRILSLRTDVRHEGELIPGEVLFTLPDGITPGTYDLIPGHRAADEAVAVRVRSVHTPFMFGGTGSEVDGAIEIGEVGERITARFAFTAADRDGETVEVEGRIHGFPFQYLPEGRFTASDDPENPWEGNVFVRHDHRTGAYSVVVGRIGERHRTFFFDIPVEVEAGSYPVRSTREGEGIYLNAPNLRGLSGEIRITREGEFAHGEFDLTNDEGIEVTGGFDYAKVTAP